MNEQPIFLMFFAFLILMAVLMVMISMAYRYKKREMQHRERLMAIEKGAALPAEESSRQAAPWSPRAFLLRGLIWLFTGIGLTVFLIGLSLTTRHEGTVFERVNQAGIAKASGATEEQIRKIMNDKEAHGLPLGVALIGLIPIGLGLAYLVAYGAEKTEESEVSPAGRMPAR